MRYRYGRIIYAPLYAVCYLLGYPAGIIAAALYNGFKDAQ